MEDPFLVKETGREFQLSVSDKDVFYLHDQLKKMPGVKRIHLEEVRRDFDIMLQTTMDVTSASLNMEITRLLSNRHSGDNYVSGFSGE